jgi:hypothetical protein
MNDFAKKPSITICSAFILLMLACLYLGYYTQPVSDDYCLAYTAGGFNNIWQHVAHEWTTLTGRWSSSALTYLFYRTIGIDNYYWLTIPISLLSIFLGSWFSASMIVPTFKTRMTLTFLSSFIFISIASSIGDLIFWATGFTYYTVGYALTTGSIFLAFALSKAEGTIQYGRFSLLLIISCIACGLAELFVIALWFFMIGIYIFWQDRKYLVPILVLMAVGTGLSILAPGNEERATRVEESLALIEIFKEMMLYGARGLLLPALAMYLISYIPGIREIFHKSSEIVKIDISKTARHLITAFSFGYPFAIILISLISIGAPGPGRAHNLSLFMIVVSWPIIISTFHFLRPSENAHKYIKYSMSLLGVLVLLAVNNRDLIVDIASGDAKGFYYSISDVRQTLADSSGKDMLIPITSKIPRVSSSLHFLVTEDKNHWINQCVSLFYNLNSVESSYTD